MQNKLQNFRLTFVNLLCNYKNMKYLKFILLFSLAFALFSCQDDEKQRIAETLRTLKQNDSILKVISRNWKFDAPPPTPKVAERIRDWNEYQQLISELKQKPTGTINAYLQKTKTLVNKADQLKNHLPPFFDKPQVRSRLGVLITKIKSLYTYMSIETIPDKKVILIIGEINHEVIALQNQLDEIIRISEIPKEQGEEEMLRALDTVRLANPGAVPPQAVSPQSRQVLPVNKPAGHGAGYINQQH